MLELEELGNRIMPAGITFDNATGLLLFSGSGLHDTGDAKVLDINGTPYVFASMVTKDDTGKVVQIYSTQVPLSAVKLIRAYGYKGRDLFANYTSLPSELYGGEGNDKLIGGNGNDKLSGGEGSDNVQGWNGNDTIFGGNGTDFVYGMNGNDQVHGGNGTDFSDDGGAGSDTVTGVP